MSRTRLYPDSETLGSKKKSKSMVSLLEEDDDGVGIFSQDELPASKRNKRWEEMAAVARAFKDFKPASEVLTEVRAVPTIFPQFDYVTGVGGLPIERFSLLHGESGGGKTYLSIGFLLSFLMRDHFATLIDAERTTPRKWLRIAMRQYADHPWFSASRPKSYEQTVFGVRNHVNMIRKLRDDGKIPDKTSGLIIVDSIRKLVPEDQFKRIMKEYKESSGNNPREKKEKIRDRSAQIKAAMNAAWMDEVIPLLEETKTAMVVIARETEDPDASQWEKDAGTNYKIGGGRALYYDASMDLRSRHMKAYGKKVDIGAGKKRLVRYGDIYNVDITKSKVTGKGEEFQTSFQFHISNGYLVPKGFDRARDLIEIARRFEVVEGTNWLKFKKSKWQSADIAVKRLNTDLKIFKEINAEVRSLFESKFEELEGVFEDEEVG